MENKKNYGWLMIVLFLGFFLLMGLLSKKKTETKQAIPTEQTTPTPTPEYDSAQIAEANRHWISNMKFPEDVVGASFINCGPSESSLLIFDFEDRPSIIFIVSESE